MGAYCPLGWIRTYALIDIDRPFDYGNWADAVRGGRTFSTTGPLIDIMCEGRRVGDTIALPGSGGTVEVEARAQSFWPLGRVEVVCNGSVVTSKNSEQGAKLLHVKAKVRVSRSGWIAARCCGWDNHPGGYIAAHTSPVYLKCGDARAFNGPAAQHMLALVEGGTEYLKTLSTVFDEKSRKRMVKLFKEAQKELKGRLVVEAKCSLHHGHGGYHIHGHEEIVDHQHE